MKILQIAPRMDLDVIQREYENLTCLENYIPTYVLYQLCIEVIIFCKKITFFSNAGHQRLFILVSMDLEELLRKKVIKHFFNEIQN